jgi:hypothetical protein
VFVGFRAGRTIEGEGAQASDIWPPKPATAHSGVAAIPAARSPAADQ